MHYSDIELKGIDENGNEKNYKLSDFKGEDLIVYFYPQDETPVCTKEAHEFRDAVANLENYAKLIGVSSNNIQEHLEFQRNHNLNYILLSDTGNKLKKAFEAHSEYITNIHRATFILNKKGEIIKYWDKVDVDGHIKEITDYFEKEKT